MKITAEVAMITLKIENFCQRESTKIFNEGWIIQLKNQPPAMLRKNSK